MKMPTTTNVKVEPKVSPEMGDPTKQCINCLEKKMRNLEKRKVKIEQNQEKALKGSKLEKEQEVSLRQYEQVTHDLEFARELYKQFQQIFTEHEKMSKKQAKRDKVERQTQEIKRVGEILQLQTLLDLLGGDQVREDFKTGKHGAVVLTEDNLNQLDELYQEISPSREESGYSQRLNTAADHLVALLDGKDRQVLGTTYKEMKDLITLISGCGYFDKVVEKPVKADEKPEAAKEVAEEEEEESPEPESEAAAEEVEEEEEESSSEQTLQQTQPTPSEQQPIDLTVGTTDSAQSQQDMPTQNLNTLEQDAFFAPSSSTYQVESEHQFAQQSHNTAQTTTARQVSDYQSFTNNRPFQFIQTSYIMPEVAADPAVIAAQPQGASGLQFMSQSFESSSSQQQPQQQKQQQQPQQQQQQLSSQQQSGVQQVQQQQQQQVQSQEFVSSQAYGQPGMQLTEGRYQPVEEVGRGTTTAGTSMIGGASVLGTHSPYEIPPSIPMPPSKLQDQNQLDQQTALQQQEKKFQMNASAPVFQSMFAQGVAPGPGGNMPVSVPPPSVAPASVGMTGGINEQTGMPPSDFPPPPASSQSNGDYGAQSGGAGDFHQGYTGNGFNGNFSRGGRGGGYRGNRGGAGGNGGMRNGGGQGIQNGFNNRGPGGPGNNTGGRGGRGNYQGYPPNSGYRPDGFQGTYNAGANSGGGFGGQVFSKRGGGGIGGAGGGQGGGQGYNRGAGGNMGRGGGAQGMRGGGMQRGGGQGAPRGAPRGGQFSRPAPAQ